MSQNSHQILNQKDTPLSKTTTDIDAEEEQPSSHFINITDAVKLDKTSRTQVRVQVMRDYHRRRVQKKDDFDIKKNQHSENQRPLTAKAQTSKFRVSQVKGRGLELFVPVKSGAGNGVKGKRGIRKAVLEEEGDGEGKVKRTGSRRTEPTFENHQSVALKNSRDGGEFTFNVWEENSLDELHPEGLPFDEEYTGSYLTTYSPSSNSIDPFHTTALLITPHIQLMLHHYFSIRLSPSWLMMPMRRLLFSIAITDAAMFHSFLCHYAASYNNRFSIKDSVETVYHSSMAAKIIEQRLQEGRDETALSDETIATVANMATYESSNGDREAMIVHLNGLERMVKLRGGLQNGGYSLIVQRMIGWADFHCATALLATPRFPPLNLPGLALQYPSANPTLTSLLSGIRILSSTLLTLRSSIAPPENILYSDQIYTLQRHLFDIAYTPSTPVPFLDPSLTPRITISTLTALTALIFCGHVLRDIPFEFKVHDNAVRRLKSSILGFDGGEEEQTDEEKKRMFWVLAFGGLAAEGRDERGWFVEEFGGFVRGMELKRWEEARAILGELLWEDVLDEGGRRLWNEERGG